MDTSLQNRITADVNHLSTSYLNKTEVNDIKTNLQDQITDDVSNLSDGYFSKTDVNNTKTNLHTDTSLQNQTTAYVLFICYNS